MARLLAFAACEKAIVEQSSVISLMSLLQEINVQVPAGTILPSNAASPMQWTIVSVWEQEAGDRNRSFEQRTTLITGSNEVKLETPIALFEFKAEQHRIISQINGLPIGSAGKHFVVGYLREKGSSTWVEYGRYPITIKWIHMPAASIFTH